MSKTSKLFWIIGIIVVAIIAIMYVENKPNANDVIKIGVIMPLTGEYGYLGENILHAIKLAEVELEAALGKEIEIIAEDDVLDSTKGLSAYQKLVNFDKIDALIMGSAPTFEVIYDDAKARNLPVIAINTETRDETDDNVFGIRPAANAVSQGLGEALKNEVSGKVATVRTNDALVIKLGKIFDDAIEADTKNFYTNRDNNDYPTIATKILAENPEIIVISAYANDGAQTVKEILRQSQGNTPQIAFDSLFNEGVSEYEKILGDLNVLNGAIVTSLKTELTPAFTAAYKKMYGEEPGALADLGYDSLVTLIYNHDSDSKRWIKNIAATKNLMGATGEIKFDPVGLREAEFRIEVITHGVIPKF